MKITDVIVHTLTIADVDEIGNGTQDAAIIEVETDSGVTGIGEADSSPAVVKAIVEAPMSHAKSMGLKEVLVGADPFDRVALWDEMFEKTYFFGRRGAAINAISAIDMALWDIVGKALDEPLYNLLGGRYRESVRAYASTLFPENPDETSAVIDCAQAALDEGFEAVKFGWGAFGQDRAADERLVAAARETLGPDVDLMVDVGMRWDSDVKRAISEINDLDAAHDLYWVEEPVAAENLSGYARLRQACTTRIVGGEEAYGLEEFEQLLDRGCVDAVQPDVARSGGITQLRDIARVAAAQGIPCIPHWFSTEIILAANLQLIAASPDAPLLEYCFEDSPLRWDTVNESFSVTNGRVAIPDRPGLGVTLNRSVLEEYRTDPLG